MSRIDLQPTWRDSKTWGGFLIALYFVAAVMPLVAAYWANPSSGEPVLEELALGAALLGFSLLTLQFVLSARIPWIDQPFGLDVVMHFHKGMAILAGILLLMHPVLMAINSGSWFLLGLETSWKINLGKAALLILLFAILFALFFSKIGVDYNVWRFFHKGVVLIIILAFLHSFLIGPDLQNTGMKAYWITLFSAVILVFLIRNIYVPIWGRKRFRVSAVEQTSHDTWTLSFEPEDGTRPITHRPGQFWFLQLIRPGRPSELHPFTISSSPTGEPPLTSTIKQSGNFTDTIGQTRPGDRARIEGPFGRFSLLNYPSDHFIFIAGGVGITPIISMLRYLRDTDDQRPAILIYGNDQEQDILFREELRQMPEHIQVTHTLADPPANWDGHQGYVTTELLRNKAADMLETAEVFLCGPPVMMDKVLTSLKELGIQSSRIHWERFTI
jgi:predicted ferric reductase